MRQVSRLMEAGPCRPRAAEPPGPHAGARAGVLRGRGPPRSGRYPQLSAAASYDRSLANEFEGVFDDVAFGGGDWEKDLSALDRPISIAFRPVINNFRGRRSVEMQLADWRVDD